jgi:RNase P/RNase MRP subunit p29
VGTCRLEASQAGNNSFPSAAPVTRSIKITKISQQVTFANNTPTSKKISDAAFAITATSNVGLTVTISSETTDICEIDTTTQKVTIKKAGACKLVAEQDGNNTYNSATARHLITINKSTDIITFSPIANKTLGDDDFIVEVHAKSGDVVTLESMTKTICEVGSNNHKVYLLSAGDCRLKAEVSQTTAEIIFTIKKKVIKPPKENTPQTNPPTEQPQPQKSQAGALSLLWLLGLGLFSLLSRRMILVKS